MPAWPAFVGGSDTSRSYRASVARSINLYAEGPSTQSAPRLLLRPFAYTFATSSGVEALYTEPATARVFGAESARFVEYSGTGTVTSRGTITSTAAKPQQMSGNGSGGSQVGVVSNGLLYSFNTGTNAFAQVTSVNLVTDIRFIGFQDGYTLVLNGAGTLQWSALNDLTTWSALSFATNSITADPWVTMTIVRRQVFLLGSESGQVWVDSGDLTNPFLYEPGSDFQNGCVAPYTLIAVQDEPMWVSRTAYGRVQVMRANGYNPIAVSDAQVEAKLNDLSLTELSALRAWAFSWEGHTFYVLNPQTSSLSSTTYGASLVYDLSTSSWLEWGVVQSMPSMDPLVLSPWISNCHCVGFGKHLVNVGTTQVGQLERVA